MNKLFRLNPKFESVFLHLTNQCNLTCKHCYVESSPQGAFGIPFNTVEELVNDISNFEKPPVFILSGGEPLSRKKDCLDILSIASSKLRVRLFTNATLITQNIAKQLSCLPIEIRISIDGSNEFSNDLVRGQGTFQKILNGIYNLQDSGFPIQNLSICTTIPNISSEHVQAFLHLADNISINTVRFNALCRRGRGETLAVNVNTADVIDKWEEEKLNFVSILESVNLSNWNIIDYDSKTPLFNTINIYANGTVFPYIPHDHLNPRHFELPAGNILNQRLSDILKSQNMKDSVLKKFLVYSKSLSNPSRAFTAVKK